MSWTTKHLQLSVLKWTRQAPFRKHSSQIDGWCSKVESRQILQIKIGWWWVQLPLALEISFRRLRSRGATLRNNPVVINPLLVPQILRLLLPPLDSLLTSVRGSKIREVFWKKMERRSLLSLAHQSADLPKIEVWPSPNASTTTSSHPPNNQFKIVCILSSHHNTLPTTIINKASSPSLWAKSNSTFSGPKFKMGKIWATRPHSRQEWEACGLTGHTIW